MQPLQDVWVHRRPSGVSHGPLDGQRSPDGAHATPPSSRAWHVLSVLTRNEFRARYRAQALGILWSLLNPLVQMGILSLIFTRVFHAAAPHFPVFMLIGVVFWQWVSSGLNAGTLSWVHNADVVKRTVFPRHLLPLAALLSYGVNFAMESSLVLLLVPLDPGAFTLSPTLLLVPVILAILVALLGGLVLATSVLNVVYRDVAYLVTTSLTLLYWLTPIIYPLSIVPEPWSKLLLCNPLAALLVALRDCIMLGVWPPALVWAGMLVPTAIVVLLGWAIFRHYERIALDYV